MTKQEFIRQLKGDPMNQIYPVKILSPKTGKVKKVISSKLLTMEYWDRFWADPMNNKWTEGHIPANEYHRALNPNDFKGEM